jgi:multidrug efflux pump subunit AcrB
VDDGIVIAENIFAHYERGKSPMQAAIDGTAEVMSSVFTSVLTTIVAFSVLFFIEGLEMMAEMAFVVIACLAFSLIEAFLVLPSHLSSKMILKEPKQGVGKKLRVFINKKIAYLRDVVYGSLLTLFIKRKWISVSLPIVFGVAVISLITSNIIPVTFFPSIPFDDFTVEVAYMPGSREMQTEKTLRWAQEKVWEVNQEIIDETGDTIITNTTLQVGYTQNLGESGAHAGLVRVSLDGEGKQISSFEVATRVREKIGQIPGVYKMAVGGGNRWGKPVSIALSGLGFESMKGSMNMLKDSLNTLLSLKDVSDNAGTGKREILIELKPKAYLLGLNHNEITRQIRQGFFGQEAQRLIVGTDEVRIWVRYPEADRSAVWQLEKMRVKTSSGQSIPLDELCTYRIERGVVSINHYNGKREIMVEADLVNPYASVPEILQEVKQKFIPIISQMYPEVEISFRGQQQNAEKAGNSGGIMLMIALFLMFLIITLNFQSMYQAGLIFLVLPAGIFSSILGHGIHHLPVSILSAWGMVALLGIMVNDAVVFLDTYNRNLLKGMPIKEAIYEAGISRFRPILLTSITTVAGLFPLILEKSFQAQFLIPMATSVAYGVLFGTLFILFFFPPLVLCLNEFRRARKSWWSMKKFTAEEIEPVVSRTKRLNELNA